MQRFDCEKGQMQRQQEIVVFVYYALFDVVPEIGLQGK